MRHLILTIILVLLLTAASFGTISFNYSPIAYDSTSGDSLESSNNTIAALVILGGGHFLKSHGDFQLFLSKVELAELSGVNFADLQGSLNAAISSMESAKHTYYDLKTLAAGTPYNPTVIDKLKNFAYDGFREKGNLNPLVFREVEGFLSRGDVTGAYDRMFANIDGILTGLYKVKKDIDKNIFPGIDGLWELNRQYSNALFFGQYTAMIFNTIK